ncbi:hypothetical protein [Subtercola vilae]|uniref:hypothetical protein n=1 Tax=Subtercola vilae TaxID=2056433 RepID=UPI0010AAE4BA|nr:hypothetical protein [Subtercola vilae]
MAMLAPLVAGAIWLLMIGLIEDWDPRLMFADFVIGASVMLLAVVAVTVVVQVFDAHRSDRRIYMSEKRKAVITLMDRPDHGWWEFSNHVVKTVGCHCGEELRDAMSVPLQAAATAAGISIYGKAANEKVQNLYIEQFKTWGLEKIDKPHKYGVIWRPKPAASVDPEPETITP